MLRKLTATLLAAAGIAVVLLLAKQFLDYRISDRDLLREAVREYRRIPEASDAIVWDVFCQQAKQGYYDDALATILQVFNRGTGAQYELVALARARAQKGDLEGAKSMVRLYMTPDSKVEALEAIATIQAQRGDIKGAIKTAHLVADPRPVLEAAAVAQARAGDLHGARQTIALVGHSDGVLGAIAGHQIQSGDFDAALKTVQEMNPDNIVNPLFELAGALRRRGEQSRVRRLASHISNPKVARLFLDVFATSEKIPMISDDSSDDTYEQAGLLARKRDFAAAYSLIEKRKGLNSFVAIRQYESDPAGAEQALQRSANRMDVCFGLAEFAKAAAAHGNTSEALRLIDTAQKRCGERDAYLLEAVRHVARQWTARNKPGKVVKWARSRPNPSQRALALLGMAEALGHLHLEVSGTCY